MCQIKIEALPNGDASVAFPYDKNLVAALKKAFPKARFNDTHNTWIIPGKTAIARAQKWAGAIADEKARKAKESERVISNLVFDNSLKSTICDFNLKRTHFLITTPYHEGIVKIIRDIAGSDAEFHKVGGKFWAVPVMYAADLMAALPELERLAEEAAKRDAAEVARREAERKAQEARWAAEKRAAAERRAVEKQAALKAEQEAGIERIKVWGNRYGCGITVGQPFRYGDRIVVAIWISKGRYFGDDAMSFGGLDPDRTWDYLVKIRVATDAEAAPMLAAEEAERVRQAARKELRVIAAEIEALRDNPKTDEPQGERLRNPANAHLDIYGTGDHFVISDAEIWYIRRHTADGDLWAANNVPSGLGYRTPYSDELAQRIRAAIAAAT